ncbi:plasmolipin isoform 1-T1 [Synchiropus picturatus]
MSDFPSKVATETHAPHSQSTTVGAMIDIVFLKSIPAIITLAEILLGLIHWALIVSTPALYAAPYGWVLFVAITLWILTIVVFFVILFGVYRSLPSVPWSLVIMVYFAVATVLYLTAFVTNAVYATGISELGAAAFFAVVVTLLYGASTFFAYVDWKNDGANAATTTVPT